MAKQACLERPSPAAHPNIDVGKEASVYSSGPLQALAPGRSHPGEWAGAAVLSSHCSAASASLSSLWERLWFVPWRGPKNSQISKPGKPAAQKIVHPDSMFFRLTEAFINEVTTPIFTVCGRGTTWGDGGAPRPAPAGLPRKIGRFSILLGLYLVDGAFCCDLPGAIPHPTPPP